jgi:hypothetical protein
LSTFSELIEKKLYRIAAIYFLQTGFDLRGKKIDVLALDENITWLKEKKGYKLP